MVRALRASPSLCLAIFFVVAIKTASAVLCYKTGKPGCTIPLTGKGSGCPIGELCSIAQCCEKIIRSERGQASTENPSESLSLDPPQVKSSSNSTRNDTDVKDLKEFGSIVATIAVTVCKNATCVVSPPE